MSNDNSSTENGARDALNSVQTKSMLFSQYVEDHPVEIYIDYRDELSEDQITKVLDGHADDVIAEIEEYANTNDDLDYYWDDMASELKVDREEIDDWLAEDGFWPGQYLDEHGWNQLLNNSSAYITATVWDAEFNFNDWAYGGAVNYSDVKETLKILGINPLEFRKLKTGGSISGGDQLKGWWPDMPQREPKINPQDLWDNMIVLYNGVLNFCLGDLASVAHVLAQNSKNITFKAGTNIVMYDFGNGAGITEATLIKDLTIPRKMLTFRNDQDNRYGIQECYGFVHSYWREGEIECAN